MRAFSPPQEILDKYASVLVNYALNSGSGVNPGEVVRLVASEAAKPLFVSIRNQILRAGAHPLVFYQPDNTSRDFYELASDDQLRYFPKKFMRALANEIDHSIGIISETDKHELEGVSPDKIMTRLVSGKPFKQWLDKKENAGKFTWTLALWGTEAMAKEAGITIEEYWDQIISACFLDQPDPIASWQSVVSQINRIRKALNALPIASLRIRGEDCDLRITLGTDRQWLGGSGRNIPSFEIFTSPDWRGTEGWIRFNQPLYRYGNLITGIRLEFSKGVVVDSAATKNLPVLKKMLEVPNADKIGEFSLTDKRMSKINRFMAETLYDENISGPFGNTHIALGSAYADTYSKSQTPLTDSAKKILGFNDSAIHTDIVSTTNRQVTAELIDGSSRVIYNNGEFTL